MDSCPLTPTPIILHINPSFWPPWHRVMGNCWEEQIRNGWSHKSNKLKEASREKSSLSKGMSVHKASQSMWPPSVQNELHHGKAKGKGKDEVWGDKHQERQTKRVNTERLQRPRTRPHWWLRYIISSREEIPLGVSDFKLEWKLVGLSYLQPPSNINTGQKASSFLLKVKRAALMDYSLADFFGYINFLNTKVLTV